MIDANTLSIINYRREKAFNTLKEVQKLLDMNMLNLAINRVYYAGFYIVNALSLIDNFSTSKHKQLIGYFNKNYIHSGKIDLNKGDILNIAYRKRTSIDYHDFTTVTKNEVLSYYEQMKIFVTEVDHLIEDKLKNSLP